MTVGEIRRSNQLNPLGTLMASGQGATNMLSGAAGPPLPPPGRAARCPGRAAPQPRSPWAVVGSAHDLVNNLIRNTILELHACGYGVYVVGHIANAKIALADDITSYIPELKGVSDGLWASLQGHLDLIAAFESTVQLVKEPVYSTSNPGIKTGERTVSVSKRQIVLNSPAYAGLCGKRVRTLPDAIPLEADTAWADFEKVYNNALAQQKGLV